MSKQDQWTSKLGFILAAAGSAIGLGAIWKLPYMTGENGGGVFFLLFIIFTLLIGAPILIAEFTIGRNAQKDAISAYKHRPWKALGIDWIWRCRSFNHSSFLLQCCWRLDHLLFSKELYRFPLKLDARGIWELLQYDNQ